MELTAIYAEVAGRTMLEPERLGAFVRAASRIGPGAVAEVGVRDGGTSRFLARLYPERVVYAFDTFDGFPPNADGFALRDYAARPGTVAWLEELPNMVVRPGVFPTTTQGLEWERFALVHLDADLYETTRAALEFFLSRTRGVIVLDDFGRPECPGVRRAVEELLPNWREQVIEHNAQWQQLVLEVKS